MANPLTLILNDLNWDKQNLMRINEAEIRSEFTPYVINRFFKNSIETIMEASMMNQVSFLDKSLIYDFYLHALPKKKRFIKYIKGSKPEDEIKAIMTYYQYSRALAEETYSLLSDYQVAEIMKKVNPPHHKKK